MTLECPRCKGVGFVENGSEDTKGMDVYAIKYDRCSICETTGVYVSASSAGVPNRQETMTKTPEEIMARGINTTVVGKYRPIDHLANTYHLGPNTSYTSIRVRGSDQGISIALDNCSGYYLLPVDELDDYIDDIRARAKEWKAAITTAQGDGE